jgi:hypothetical protein
MIKVGDLVEYKRAATGSMRGIVLRVRKDEVKVQFFPATTRHAYWIQEPEENLLLVSGAVYNSE